MWCNGSPLQLDSCCKLFTFGGCNNSHIQSGVSGFSRLIITYLIYLPFAMDHKRPHSIRHYCMLKREQLPFLTPE